MTRRTTATRIDTTSRRQFLIELLLLVPVTRAARASQPPDSAVNAVAALERRFGGRLGVTVLDGKSGKTFAHRGSERFAMCSTFKLVAAAAVLHRVERGDDSLSRFIPYTERDLLEYAPVTREHVSEGGMSLGDLCAAAVEVSDNTAANLILATLGGPSGLTRYCRSLGDTVTRLDRTEPTLNIVPPGEIRDTTTPAAMLGLMRTILLGNALSAASRRQLEDWLVQAKVGDDRVRAGLPESWKVGHKTGTGPRGETNDLVVTWPRQGEPPVLIASYYAAPEVAAERRPTVLAEVGRAVASFAK